MPADKLPRLLAAVPGWKLSDDKTAISRSFVAKNFVAAMEYFNKVAAVAEAEGHHPDLHLTSYRDVQVRDFLLSLVDSQTTWPLWLALPAWPRKLIACLTE